MPFMLVFGPGYAANAITDTLAAEGWEIRRVARNPRPGDLAFADRAAVLPAIAAASHILSSVPPGAEGDPVLATYGAAIAASRARWVGYLSSTGVYGDAAGGWVDESAPLAGRRGGRNIADAAWLALHPQARVFRLPGIYGPGRSALDRVAEGKAHRIDLPKQVFSRVHVADIAGGVIASIAHGPPGAYNLADDAPCSQNRVIEAACDLIGRPWPPLLPLAEANLSPMALAFYAENRRVANGKARRLLRWQPRHPDFHAGLRAIMRAEARPAPPAG
ncbi:SDR family NAD(P)-dependent oxidoreductase [Sphingomonas solaris]|uniref:SDR family NAD(P)-dependent oxidoreductase n=1 Tax=Alterirhizorhabdus solaris TaxID=2529389 RepID=A0A558QY85_9SPHN|nr:SDR family NAD(P)-dependent oxidoreductase [Sphingomonas solaris]TVV72069.1 SDR family NAD(P)-dependent oxidoreductase [Sphingomonas solaris]